MTATLTLWLIKCLQQQHYISVIDSAVPACCLFSKDKLQLSASNMSALIHLALHVKSTPLPARRVMWHQLHLAQSVQK